MISFEKANDIKYETMKQWCIENKKLAWLKEHGLQKIKVEKDGKTIEKDKPFLVLRSEFVKEFFPQFVSNKGKKKTFYDDLRELDI